MQRRILLLSDRMFFPFGDFTSGAVWGRVLQNSIFAPKASTNGTIHLRKLNFEAPDPFPYPGHFQRVSAQIASQCDGQMMTSTAAMQT